MSFMEQLDGWTEPGVLALTETGAALRCVACAHRCLLRPGRRGICGVRSNRDGRLMVPRGYVAGLNLDPVEKKPFTHFLPGSRALTFGMLGCNFHCDFCQNWLSSQVLRDPQVEPYRGMVQGITARQIVEAALAGGARVIASSYNEPVITAEWAHEVFSLAKTHDIRCVMVSNGYATRECLEYLRPVMDGYKIDLKSMREQNYRAMGGRLQFVLESIQTAHELGYWVEVVTLVIPGFNDSPAELWDTARAVAGVSADIPWHVTGFHPDYRMQDARPTSAADLQQAADIGQEAGLRYVYAGNLPGRVGSLEDTHCPGCGLLLVKRRGYSVGQVKVTPENTCPGCGQAIAGVWL